jgi:sugar phosphate isomerase/epimerase
MTTIAAQGYTVREYMQTREGIDESFARLARTGWQAVQLSAWGQVEDSVVRGLADEHGLTICATHIPFSRLWENLEDMIVQHRVFGCRYVGLGSMPPEYRDSAEGFVRFARDISPIAQRLADAGLNFLYHNHNFEFARFGTRTGMDILLEECVPQVQFELDTYWVQAGGGDVKKWLEKCAGRIDVVHFKDMVYDHEQKGAVFAEIGEGNLDWPSIIAKCGQLGVKWHIVEQDTCKGDPFESLAVSYRNLMAYGLR